MARRKGGNFGDWDVWFLVTNEKSARKLFDQNLRHAGAQIGAKGVQMITDLFAAGRNPPMVRNAPLTWALGKRGSKPLINEENRLMRSHAFDQPEAGIVRIGSKATSDEGVDITRALHYGFVFNLKRYPKMARWLRWKLGQLEKAGKLNPGGPIRGPHGKPGHIVIPPRPWMAWLFKDREFRDFVIERGRAALASTLGGRSLRTGRRSTRRGKG